MTIKSQKITLSERYPCGKLKPTEIQKRKLSEYCCQWRRDHREQQKRLMAEWCRNHREDQNRKRTIWQRDRRIKTRREILQLLGGKCAQCGYQGPALQIDHVRNNGSEERRANIHLAHYQYYMMILEKIKAGSRDYQVLCANCNWLKQNGGYL